MDELFLSKLFCCFVYNNILEFSIPPDAKTKKADEILNLWPWNKNSTFDSPQYICNLLLAKPEYYSTNSQRRLCSIQFLQNNKLRKFTHYFNLYMAWP